MPSILLLMKIYSYCLLGCCTRASLLYSCDSVSESFRIELVNSLLNVYLTLVCIYLPKLYAIHFAVDEDLSVVTWRAITVSVDSLGNIQVHPSYN